MLTSIVTDAAIAESRVIPAPRPPDEAERLEALRGLDLLDTAPEPPFEDLVSLAAFLCRTTAAGISLVDADRLWFKARRGIRDQSVPRDLSACGHTILTDDLTVVPDARGDERFHDNPAVVAGRLRFYAGAPLHGPDGHRLGALCVMDARPREFTQEQQDALRALARQAEAQIELRLALKRVLAHEEELRRKHDALVTAQRQKAQLAAHIVHDLKGPLAVVVAGARFLVEQDEQDEEAREAARDIGEAAGTMSRRVMDLLDVERGASGQLLPKTASTDLRELARRVVRSVGTRLRARRQELVLDVAAAVPILIDAELISRVVENLLDNCMKYAPAASRISLAVQACADGGAQVTIADEGPGVPPDLRTRIFDRYFQLDEHRGESSSRGMGLAFCKLAVEAHGGHIWVEPNEPRGARFQVRLPGAVARAA